MSENQENDRGQPATEGDRRALVTEVNRGVAWVGTAASLVGVLDLVALAILLRGWVSAADYGVAALAITLFPILDLATDMGLGSALIQRNEDTPDKLSTVFWLNVGMSLLLLGLLALVAPLLGRLHGHPIVCHMLLVYGGKLVFQNVYFIPAAMLRRDLRFGDISKLRVLANVGEFAGKIGFAAAGFGIWAFVLGPLVRIFVLGVGTQVLHPFRPRLVFRLGEAKRYLAFGLRTSASQILFQVYSNLDYQVVALAFGTAATGFYRIAYELVLEPVRVISSVVVDIAFPVFARLRADRSALVERLTAFSRQNLVFVSPFLVLILIDAEDLLSVVVGPAWVSAAGAARVLCLVGALRAISMVLPPLLDGVGRPGTTLAYTAVAALLVTLAMTASAWLLGPTLGYVSVAVGWAVGYPIAFILLLRWSLNAVGWSARAYLRRLVGIPLCAIVAGSVGLGVRWFAEPLPPAYRLVLISASMTAALGLLLAHSQGIGPRTVRAALREARS